MGIDAEPCYSYLPMKEKIEIEILRDVFINAIVQNAALKSGADIFSSTPKESSIQS